MIRYWKLFPNSPYNKLRLKSQKKIENNFSDHGADLTTDTDSFMIGQRVYVGGVKSGRITFIGEVHFAPGEWAGIVLDDAEG